MAWEAIFKPPWLRRKLFILELWLLMSCYTSFASSTTNGTLQKSTCNQRDCLRCDLDTAECVKCLYVMMSDSRICHSACPPGYSTTWAAHPSQSGSSTSNAVMGRVCSEQSMLALVSGRDVGIIAGAAVAGAVCVGVIIGALLYMRRKTKPLPDHPRQEHCNRHMPPRLWRDKRPKATEVSVAGEERAEFLAQLKGLRGEADNFLEMLSETRNRFRRLGGPDSATDTKAKAYRAVVRDLSRVLTLLNRREEHIVTVPGDWRRLLSWASRVLIRYKRQKAAKEAGDIPSLEPLATGGGTLYQTRRQAQAERCRLVALGAPCGTPNSNYSSGMSNSPRGTDGPPTPCRETPPASQISSRSTSMISLSPIILEEEDEDAPENPEDILFDESLDTTPPSTKKTEKHDLSTEEKIEEHDSDIRDEGKKGIFVIDMKGKDDLPSVHLNSKNAEHEKKLKNSYLENELEKRGIPVISQEELLLGYKYVKETNNNFTKKLNDINDLHTIINNGYITSPSVFESLKNLKNMEHLKEGKNPPSPYLKMDGHLQRSKYENQKFTYDMYEKEKEVKTDNLNVQKPSQPNVNTYNSSNPSSDTKLQATNSPKTTETNVDTSANPMNSPIGTQQNHRNDEIRVTLPGDDVYINIIRKPVVTGLMQPGDPYRDDTIENAQESRNATQGALRSGKVPAVSCKVEASRHLVTPRCELTTEL